MKPRTAGAEDDRRNAGLAEDRGISPETHSTDVRFHIFPNERSREHFRKFVTRRKWRKVRRTGKQPLCRRRELRIFGAEFVQNLLNFGERALLPLAF